MKLGLAAATLILVAGGAVGCGGDDGSGGSDEKTASKADFCGAFQAFYDDIQGISGEEDNLGEILKKAANRIEDVGTPEGIPDDAKEGLQLTLEAIDDLPDDATAEDMAGLEGDFSEEDTAKADAFTEYLAKTCPELGGSGDSETDSGSGSSDDPSGGS